MATIWLTYAWEDNKNQDIDFCAQELNEAGLALAFLYARTCAFFPKVGSFYFAAVPQFKVFCLGGGIAAHYRFTDWKSTALPQIDGQAPSGGPVQLSCSYDPVSGQF